YQHVCHCGNERMHLELRCEESGNCCEECTQNHTDYQCKNHSSHKGHTCEIKDMSEDTACIDSLVHDNRRSCHTHTYHTSDGKIRTGEEDQTRNTKRKEHSR